VRWISVETDDPPAWRDPFGQQLDDAARSAAEVDRAATGTQVNPIQQIRAVRCQLVSLTLQASALAAAAAERIDRVWIDARATGRTRVRSRGLPDLSP
jgi:hypothetical protein